MSPSNHELNLEIIGHTDIIRRQRLWSCDITALYKSIIIIILTQDRVPGV